METASIIENGNARGTSEVHAELILCSEDVRVGLAIELYQTLP